MVSKHVVGADHNETPSRRIVKSRHCLNKVFFIQMMTHETYVSQFQRKVQCFPPCVHDVEPDAACDLGNDWVQPAINWVLPEAMPSRMLSVSFLFTYAHDKCCHRVGDEFLVMVLIKTCDRRADPGEPNV